MNAANAVVADNSLKGLVLPPMPQALQAVREEQAKAEPDMARVSEAIAHDVSLAAEVLRVINSPAFGLNRTIESIRHAVTLLGITNVSNVVSGTALRASLSGLAHLQLEHFWDTANDVALVTARVVKEFTGIAPDTGYAMGLFHDCGIPLLMGLRGDYEAVIKTAVESGQRITDAESHHFGLTHAALGHHVARHWRLPPVIAQGILEHHNYPEVLTKAGVSDEARILISALKIGEHVSETFRGLAFRREDPKEWPAIGGQVLEHLGVEEVEFVDLRDAMLEMLGEQ